MLMILIFLKLNVVQEYECVWVGGWVNLVQEYECVWVGVYVINIQLQ